MCRVSYSSLPPQKRPPAINAPPPPPSTFTSRFMIDSSHDYRHHIHWHYQSKMILTKPLLDHNVSVSQDNASLYFCPPTKTTTPPSQSPPTPQTFPPELP
ncbi:hypothetical protein NW759_007368 [Fusarium solani]|nr:hypothetical protein NW759_007368 [Fusarium solani]